MAAIIHQAKALGYDTGGLTYCIGIGLGPLNASVNGNRHGLRIFSEV